MNLLTRIGLFSALVVFLDGSMSFAHADQVSIAVKARFDGMHRGFLPKEDRQQNLGDIRTVVIRTDEELEQFKQGIPVKAVGMYREERRPLSNDPLRDQKINFGENILVVALRDMAHCDPVSIDSAYQEGKTLVVRLIVPATTNNGDCQSDGSARYSAAVIQAVGLNVEFKKN